MRNARRRANTTQQQLHTSARADATAHTNVFACSSHIAGYIGRVEKSRTHYPTSCTHASRSMLGKNIRRLVACVRACVPRDDGMEHVCALCMDG